MENDELLKLPMLEPQTVTVEWGDGPMPPEKTYWTHNGEVIFIDSVRKRKFAADTVTGLDDVPGMIYLVRDIGSLARSIRHEAGYWVRATVYHP